MPFCRECGKEVEASWMHCAHCGSQQPVQQSSTNVIQDSVVTNETNITIYNDPEVITRGIIAAITEYSGKKFQSEAKLPQRSKEVAKSMAPRMSMDGRFALIVRCNPAMWNWSAEIPELGTAVIPWRTRLKKCGLALLEVVSLQLFSPPNAEHHELDHQRRVPRRRHRSRPKCGRYPNDGRLKGEQLEGGLQRKRKRSSKITSETGIGTNTHPLCDHKILFSGTPH